jgi:hypothetical protein
MPELIVTEKGIKVSDETPRGQCWIFHKWNRWETIAQGMYSRPESKTYTARFIEQKRECLRCGKIQMREEKC